MRLLKLSAVELAHILGARLRVLTVMRDIDGILEAKVAGTLGYDVIGGYLETRIADLIRKAGAGLVVVGSHGPAMKDYLLGTNASCIVRHARCSVLIARE